LLFTKISKQSKEEKEGKLIIQGYKRRRSEGYRGSEDQRQRYRALIFFLGFQSSDIGVFFFLLLLLLFYLSTIVETL